MSCCEKTNDHETLMRVAMQRDELRHALENLIDKIRHGVCNHMLPEKTDRAHSDGPETKCKNGHDRAKVLWCMGRMCQDCDGIGKCHLSFEEKDLFESMQNAGKIADKPCAEMPEIKPDSFVTYVPESEYRMPALWIAREMYRFCVGYWVYSDHGDNASEKAWERVFNDILCISLDSIGRNGKSFRELLDIMENGDLDKDVKKFADDHPEIGELLQDAVKSADSDVDVDVSMLVMRAVLLRTEYQFAHDYPGSDMGVYGDVFGVIIHYCLVIAGIDPKDRPKSYDFEDKDEYERKLIEYDAKHREKIINFMTNYGILDK